MMSITYVDLTDVLFFFCKKTSINDKIEEMRKLNKT